MNKAKIDNIKKRMLRLVEKQGMIGFKVIKDKDGGIEEVIFTLYGSIPDTEKGGDDIAGLYKG